jgi:hypothetical protein
MNIYVSIRQVPEQKKLILKYKCFKNNKQSGIQVIAAVKGVVKRKTGLKI